MIDLNAPAHPGFAGWSNADDQASHGFGWGIFDCDGSENGRFQLCRDDEAAIFDGDDGAWRHVTRLAGEGDVLAQRAVAFIQQHNPAEWTAIREDLGI